jgi:adenylate cyclase
MLRTMDKAMSAETLAELAQAPAGRIEKLTALGLLTGDDGHFSAGDVHRIRLVDAFEAAGVPAEALARASERGAISLNYYDQLHPEPVPRSGRTYDEFMDGLPDRGAILREVLATVGIAEPEPDGTLSTSDESILEEIVDTIVANNEPDLAMRAVRIYGEAARRTSEAAMSVYAEAVERATDDIAGIPPQDVYERFLEPWARFARLAPRLSAWLSERHLSAAIDAWSVEETERLLADSGFVPAPEVEEPAVAFVDLTGFTQLAEQHGDRTAAAVAARFADMAREVVGKRQGRLVKQLGDGVLVRYPSASRLANEAAPGDLIATATFADSLPAGEFQAEPMGAVELKGISHPTQLVRLSRRS